MPIPKINNNEDPKKFISRCMGDKVMQEYEQEKRSAICISQSKKMPKTNTTKS